MLMSVLIPLIAFLQALFGWKLATLPDQSTNQKTKCKHAMFLMGAATFVLAITQAFMSGRHENERGKQIDAFKSSIVETITNSQKELKAQLADVRSKITTAEAAKETYERMYDEAVTNINIAAEARLRLLREHETRSAELGGQITDLQTWEKRMFSKVRDIQREDQIGTVKKLTERNKRYMKAIPSFEYTIRKLLEISERVAAQNTNSVTNTYSGLPISLKLDDPSPIPLGEIRLTDRSEWKIELFLLPDGYADVQLGINGHGSFFNLLASGDADLTVKGLRNTIKFHFFTNDLTEFNDNLSTVIFNEYKPVWSLTTP